MPSGKEFIGSVLNSGRIAFSHDEAAEAFGKSGQLLNMILQRLKADGRIIPFARGFYLVLDFRHQASGTLDPHWIVDEWSRYLAADYYVGGLSAAALHGAGHQPRAVFQVFMNKNIRSVACGSDRFDIYYKKDIPVSLVEKRKSPGGKFRVSGPELTAYDLLAYRACCPSLNQAAAVYAELGKAIEPLRLVELLRRGGCRSVLQRLGWMLERTGWTKKTEALRLTIETKRRSWRTLDSQKPARGTRDDRWRILVNADIHMDLARRARPEEAARRRPF